MNDYMQEISRWAGSDSVTLSALGEQEEEPSLPSEHRVTPIGDVGELVTPV